MCDTNCSAMRPCGGPFCPYVARTATCCVQSDKETPTSFAEQTQPVVVIPLAQWQRLVELYALLWDGTGRIRTGISHAVDAIIESVEVPHD